MSHTGLIGHKCESTVFSVQEKKKSTALNILHEKLANYMMKQNLWGGYGGLGPDISRDEVKLRTCMRSKVDEFSSQLREVNRVKLNSNSDKADSSVVPEKQPSTRERALNFAKLIPKPKRVFPLVVYELECNKQSESIYIDSLMEKHEEMELLIRGIKYRNDF